jgi:FkbH-like protein
MAAIRRHPEMVLRVEDFAGWRINWEDKAQNIIELLAELNLGPQSAVFIDDNPVERARVAESLPEVLVPEWPNDPLMYPSTLLSLRCFDVPSLSREDADRARMYLSETKRRELKRAVGSVEEWLARLSIRVRMDRLGEENLQRAAQLLNKTNQMNLSTRRMSETELLAWAKKQHHHLWTLRVSDKYGDAGLTGIVSMVARGHRAQLIDFILSCRVMGRHIEDVMTAAATDCARELGLEEVCAEYRPTPKNKPCLNYFQSLVPPFKNQGHWFTLKTDHPFTAPGHIEVLRRDGCK